MSRNFLDADESLLEKNLRFVQKPVEDDLQQFFGEQPESSVTAPPRDFKVVTPKPGFCVKTFKTNSNEKFFINVCQTDEIPAPKDVTEEELTDILKSDEVGAFRVPMSISEPRVTKDKSDNPVDVCDIAVNPKFFVKCQKSMLFKEFFLAIVSEAVSEKYNIQINLEKAIILNNRKFIGTLVNHRVRNNDVKTALTNNLESLTAAENETLASLSAGGSGKPLVQELGEKELNAYKGKSKSANVPSGFTMPEYELHAKLRKEKVSEIQAEFYLPKCLSSQEFTLDIGEDRLLLACEKHGYYFDKFVNYNLKQELAKAIFDKANKMLQVRIPVYPIN